MPQTIYSVYLKSYPGIIWIGLGAVTGWIEMQRQRVPSIVDYYATREFARSIVFVTGAIAFTLLVWNLFGIGTAKNKRREETEDSP